MKARNRLALASLTASAALVTAFLVPTTVASAHGTMSDPASRVYTCKNEGPENPKSDACKAAVAAGGTQAFYDWNEVSLLDAGGRHRVVAVDRFRAERVLPRPAPRRSRRARRASPPAPCYTYIGRASTRRSHPRTIR